MISLIQKLKLLIAKSFIHGLYMRHKLSKKHKLLVCNSTVNDSISLGWQGGQDIHADYFLEHILGTDYTVKPIPSISAHVLDQKDTLQGNGIDILLQPSLMPYFSGGPTQLILPYWAEFDVNLEGKDFENNYASFQKVRYYTRKAGFTPVWPEMTPELIDEFYYDMVVPFIEARKGSKAMKFTRAYFAGIAHKNGSFLFLERDGKLVAGMVVLMDAVPMYHTIGIRMNDDKDHFADGAFKSLFYFAHIHMQKLGYNRVTVGGSRPFLNDPSLIFKLQIGCEPIKNRILRDEILLLKVLIDNQKVREWLSKNPFISLDSERQPHPTFFIPFTDYCDLSIVQKFQDTAMHYHPAISHIYVFDSPAQFVFDVFPLIRFFSFKSLLD